VRDSVPHGLRSNRSPSTLGDGDDAPAARLPGRPSPRPNLGRSIVPHLCVPLFGTLLLLRGASHARAADYDTALTAFRAGNYAEALQSADEAIKQTYAESRWWRLQLECLATLGRYREGVAVFELSQRQHRTDAPIALAGYEVLRLGGSPQKARELLGELLSMAGTTPWRFSSPEDRTAVGRAAVLAGTDAREVLEKYYDPAQKIDPQLRDAYLAVGDLALLKNDLAVAAETFRKGLEHFPDDPDLLVGLARSIDDDNEARAAVEKALEQNPRHLPSLFYQAEEALSHEDFTTAGAALDRIAAVNGRHPKAWALRAVLAHLQADPFGEWYCREAALEPWPENPEVEHVIGAKLSRAYRFAEGAAYQRQALAKDTAYLPARAQLAQDLLRLGESDEGWKLVGEVQQADPYDVPAFNLSNLKDRLDQYTTLTSEHFRLHMDRREAAIYGPRVLALLERACDTLGRKYGWKPLRPVTVEILTRQQDFAIRTFGIPGGDGILGVCFGYVITANSPAALAGTTTNWEATLWHEYCHVVTLEMTRHRIPRWLSEGISVYEERQADPRWGDRLDRDLRTMILEGEMAKVAKLADLFRRPKSGEHFNLAYYQASLVVEHLVDTLGHATLRKVLDDVALGMPINESLELRAGTLAKFESSFDTFARKKAAAYGAKVDWRDDDLPAIPKGKSTDIAAWLEERPNHYLGRVRYARALVEEGQLDRAGEVLRTLVADAPEWAGDESPYTLLAKIHRDKKDTAGERKVLENSAGRSEDALETFKRLIELAIESKDEAALHRNVERYLAVRPLDEFPYRSAAEHSARKEDAAWAVSAARSLVAIEPDDRSGAHYLLATKLHAAGDTEAKRQVLLALEETPRYRDAQKLLLKIVADAKQKPDAKKPDKPPTSPSAVPSASTPRQPTRVEP
jgi:predicted Zn-dependent protease